MAKEKSDGGVNNFAKDGYNRWTDTKLKSFATFFGTRRYFSCGWLFIKRKIINPVYKGKGSLLHSIEYR